MRALPLSPVHSGGPLLVALLSSLAFFFEPLSGDWLAYDRYAIEGWETWRLLTGNLVHTNGYHLLLNLAGLTLLWALHGDYYRIGRFFKVLIWCCLGTSGGLYILSQDLIWYAGLSGALHGLFTWGACMDIRQGLKSGWLLLIGVAIKIGYEQVNGSSNDVASLIDATVAVDAHLYGAVCGVALFILMWRLTKTRS
ncbi:rhombosortase [Alteromonas halophila]|uniref:rhombosortase n=1 Tax=Alteromonas halophila TaxID=516698 RepID=UPI00167B25B2|nr:rhombosortase [Alteromonas halophila]